MTAYYIDLDSGNDGNAGTSTGAPWLTLQKGADTIVAGDIAYVKGSETLTVKVDFDTNSGTNANIISFIGVNGSWVDDGTKFTIDANSVAVNCIDRTVQYIYIKNAEFINSTGYGIDTGQNWIFDNVKVSNCGNWGLNSAGTELVNQCHFNGNTNYNVLGSTFSMIRSQSTGSGRGVYGASSMVIIDSLVYNNTVYCVQAQGSLYMSGCSIDDAPSCIYLNKQHNAIVNTRITNWTTWGIQDAGAWENTFLNNVYFYSASGTDIRFDNTKKTNVRVTADNSDDGYLDQAGGDFTLTSGNDGVGVSNPIGLVDEATNIAYPTQGSPPLYPTTTAPTFAGITKFEILSNNKFYIEWAVATGIVTSYNIYIRNATSVFAGAYLAMMVANDRTSVIVHLDGNTNTLLAGGTIYYCGVKAENNGTEDTNVVELTNICSGSETIQRMTNTYNIV